MSLPSTYNPKDFEDQIYLKWQSEGVGAPENQTLKAPKPKVLFATTNNHKIKLFKLAWERQGLDQKFELLTFNDVDTTDLPQIVEDSGSFEGDAILKARVYAQHFNLPTISQDRGFELESLNGWPGTDSKKVMFGTEDVVWRSTDQWENEKDANSRRVQLVLDKLYDLDRSMSVVQGLAIALPDGNSISENFKINGRAGERIVNNIGGTFDWFFIPDDLGHILAEFESQDQLDEFASEKMYPITPGILDFLSKFVANTSYSVLMPPPNLTGDLHAGHAFQHYIMDTLTRAHRQNNEKSLWYPGVDHAGIQLEGVVDKLIKKGDFDDILLSKLPEIEDIPREDWPKWLKDRDSSIWTELAWSKVNLWRDNQKKQSSVLGDTPDYDRSLFTLDDRANRMVNYAFEKYWQDGLIYKSSYLVNWSVGLQTAVSDVAGEIEYEKRVDPFITFEYQFGDFDNKLDLNIQLVSNDENFITKNTLEKIVTFLSHNPIKVSTVRPETIFGDVAIAVHPKIFESWLKNSGTFEEFEVKNIITALNNENKKGINALRLYFGIKSLNIKRVKLILADEVDPDFGTGALKITPASDLVDYEIFNKYLGGAFPSSVGRDGRLTEVCGEYAGLTVEQGRLATIKTLIQTGYIPTKEEYQNDKDSILAKAKENLESQSFNPTAFSYIEGQKRLREILGEVDDKLQIDWSYQHNVTICERSKTVIEPLISEEFFLSYHKTIGEPSNDEFLMLGGRVWTLNFKQDGTDTALNNIVSGRKTIETRALNPEEPGRYFGDIVPEDIIELSDRIDNKTYRKMVKNVSIYNNLEDAFEKGLDFSAILPEIQGNYTIYDIKEIYENHFGQPYLEKIQNNGLVAIELVTLPENNLKNIGLQAVSKTNFYPADTQERAANFLENIKDWCISRDLVWGHKMPIWYNLELNPGKVFYSFSDWEQSEKVRQAFQISATKPDLPGDWVQEKKILDTWFSSCLWPLSTLDYIDFINGRQDTDFEQYYSTTDMITGVDILYQWIVRMMTVSKYFTGKIPYKNVILNPTVRDEQGRKMSKSLGNGLDAVTQINKFSSDSLRLAMLSGMIPNRNFRLGGNIADKMCEKYRNFGNKLWNVARFLESR